MSSHERVLGFTTVNVGPAFVDGYQVILDKENGAITPLNHKETVDELPPSFSMGGSAEVMENDQDTVRTLADQQLGLYGVFDDIEGTDASTHASKAIRDYYYKDPSAPLSLDEAVTKVEGAFQWARQQSPSDNAKTAASVFKLEEINGQRYAVWAHAGHCRAYIFTKESEIVQLTKDQGIINRAINWIGKRRSGIKDVVDYVALKPEDRIMLCNSAVTDGLASRQPKIEDFKTTLTASSDLNEQSEHFLSRSKTKDTSKAAVMIQVDGEHGAALEEEVGGRFDKRLKIFKGRSLLNDDFDKRPNIFKGRNLLNHAAVQYGHIAMVKIPRGWAARKRGERLKKRNIVAAGLGVVALAAAAYVLGHEVLDSAPKPGRGASVPDVSNNIVDIPSHKSPPSAPKVIPESSGSGAIAPKEISIKVKPGEGFTDAITDYAKKNSSKNLTPDQSYRLYEGLDVHGGISADNTYRMANGDLGVSDPRRPVKLNLEQLKEGLKSLKRGFKQ